MSCTDFSLAKLSTGDPISWYPYAKKGVFKPYCPKEKKLIADMRKKKSEDEGRLVSEWRAEKRSFQSASAPGVPPSKETKSQAVFKKTISKSKNGNRDNYGISIKRPEKRQGGYSISELVNDNNDDESVFQDFWVFF